ncbi:MAG: type II toxin-antitoxin system CcdA family antitoxin [Thermoplasmataceae archaeon]
MTKLVSVRVDEKTLAEAKRLKINFSEVMRESLESEIERRNERDFLESLSKIRKLLKSVDRNQLLEDLRKDRDERR